MFALGLRYYGKLLAVVIFPVSTVGQRSAPGDAIAPSGSAVSILTRSAAITGGTTVIGVTLGTAWGWTQTYLWVVAATVVFAGTLAAGHFWLRSKVPSNASVFYYEHIVGKRNGVLANLSIAWVLILLLPVVALTVAQTIFNHRATVVFLVIQLLLAVGLTIGRPAFAFGTGRLIGYGTALLVIVASAFLGATIIEATPYASIKTSSSGDHPIWIIAIVLISLTIAGVGARPRSHLTPVIQSFCGIGGLIFALVVGLAIATLSLKSLATPLVGAPPSELNMIVWLLVVLSVTGGAVSLSHLLIPPSAETHAVQSGSKSAFSSALIDGLTALTIIWVLTNSGVFGIALPELRGGTTSIVDVTEVLVHSLGDAVGGTPFMRTALITLASLWVCNLCLLALRLGIGAMTRLMPRIDGYRPPNDPGSLRLPLVVFTLTVLAILLTQIPPGITYWLLLGLASSAAVSAGFFVLLAGLARYRRSTGLTMIVGGAFTVVTAIAFIGLEFLLITDGQIGAAILAGLIVLPGASSIMASARLVRSL